MNLPTASATRRAPRARTPDHRLEPAWRCVLCADAGTIHTTRGFELHCPQCGGAPARRAVGVPDAGRTASSGLPHGALLLKLLNTALGGSIARVRELSLELADCIEADGHRAEATTIRGWFYDRYR